MSLVSRKIFIGAVCIRNPIHEKHNFMIYEHVMFFKFSNFKFQSRAMYIKHKIHEVV